MSNEHPVDKPVSEIERRFEDLFDAAFLVGATVSVSGELWPDAAASLERWARKVDLPVHKRWITPDAALVHVDMREYLNMAVLAPGVRGAYISVLRCAFRPVAVRP